MLTAGSTLVHPRTSILVISRTQSSAENFKGLFVSNNLQVTASSYCAPLDPLSNSWPKAIIFEVDTPTSLNECLEIVAKIRQENDLTLIFIVITHPRSVTKIKCYLAGADYCLQSSNEEGEQAKFVAEIFEAPEWQSDIKLALDPTCLCLRGQEQTLEISYSEMKILNKLIGAQNNLLSHDDIAEVLEWNVKFYDPRALEKTISRLRGKIKKAFNINAIHSVRGFGYRLCRGLISLK